MELIIFSTQKIKYQPIPLIQPDLKKLDKTKIENAERIYKAIDKELELDNNQFTDNEVMAPDYLKLPPLPNLKLKAMPRNFERIILILANNDAELHEFEKIFEPNNLYIHQEWKDKYINLKLKDLDIIQVPKTLSDDVRLNQIKISIFNYQNEYCPKVEKDSDGNDILVDSVFRSRILLQCMDSYFAWLDKDKDSSERIEQALHKYMK
ncbi:hypothetical protein [uncultured Lactobacillus sp.]|uniref:hypothetical protein n=1 Tax=uncultured Lactobacillus sp. TaxID=153152 RepID=UPI002803E28E|nr:hypothetical protein [uncultured Lactobacillus sp.]